MLATTGYLVNDLKITLPGYLSFSSSTKFEDVPTGLAVLSTPPPNHNTGAASLAYLACL